MASLQKTSIVDIDITPEALAEAFWGMDDHEQADFFESLAKEIERYNEEEGGLAGFGEMQWCYMHETLKERKGKALSMYLALSSFAFEFAQDVGSVQQKIE